MFAKTSATITSPIATPIQNAPGCSSCTRLRFSDEVELLTLALSFVYWRRPHPCHAGMSSEAPVAQAIRLTFLIDIDKLRSSWVRDDEAVRLALALRDASYEPAHTMSCTKLRRFNKAAAASLTSRALLSAQEYWVTSNC